jgi:asparagine synthetase B (glutamine-hydrolysing)
MCGIALTNNNLLLVVEELHYRGVDSYSKLTKNELSFHFFRLAFIGKDEKYQKILSNERFIILFNGEIYNYKDLALCNSVEIPESDGEIILNLLEIGFSPKDIFQSIIGMYAIVIYDTNLDNIFITRDFYGQKPLWLINDNENWLFTSELKSSRSLIIDNAAFYDYLHAPIDNFNLLSNAMLLEPGYYYEFHVDNKRNLQLLTSSILFNNDVLLKKEEVNAMLLEDSFSGVVNTDFGKVGILLSGGVDSTLVAGILSKGILLNSISFRTSENSFESNEVIRTSKYLNLPCEIIELDDISVEDIDLALDVYFLPSWDSSVPLTYKILSRVNGKYKVVITGDGGDELYHGYSRHRLFNLRLRIPKLFKIYTGRNRLLRIIFGSDEASILYTYIPFYRFLDKRVSKRVIQAKFLEESYRNAIHEIDRKYVLQNLLRRVDLLGLVNNIEVRSPLLNLKLKFDFRFSIKLIFQNKPRLRKILADFNLKSLVSKKKKGFEFNYPKIYSELLEKVRLSQDLIEKFDLSHIEFDKLEMSDKHHRNLILHLYSSFRFYKNTLVKHEG